MRWCRFCGKPYHGVNSRALCYLDAAAAVLIHAALIVGVLWAAAEVAGRLA